MSVNPNCAKCGSELQSSWKTCPFCGTAIVAVERIHPVSSASPPIDLLDGPYSNPELLPPESKDWYAQTQAEGRSDLTFVGIGLILLGLLGFGGGAMLILNGNLRDLGSFESVTYCILLGGCLLIAMVIGGTSMIATSSKSTPAANTATGIMGGLLAGVMVVGLVGLTIAAAIIYAIQDCLNGCR